MWSARLNSLKYTWDVNCHQQKMFLQWFRESGWPTKVVLTTRPFSIQHPKKNSRYDAQSISKKSAIVKLKKLKGPNCNYLH